MMTSKERMERAFRCEEVDRVPVFCEQGGINRRALGISYREMVTDGELNARTDLAWHDLIGDDGVGVYFDTCVLAEGFGQKLTYLADEPPYPDPQDYLIKSPDDYAKLERFDIQTAPRFREMLKGTDLIANEVGDEVLVRSISVEPLVTLGEMRGMQQLLMDCLRCPDEVRAALEIVTDMEIEFCRALIDHGVRWMMLCHDYGNASLLREQMWLDLEGDCLKRLHRAIREKDCYLLVHDCDPNPYVDASFSLGDFDAFCLWSLPKGTPNWAEFKETYGHVCLNGVWEPRVLGGERTYDQVVDESMRMIADLGPTGFILGPGCEFPQNGAIINARAMVDASRAAAGIAVEPRPLSSFGRTDRATGRRTQ
jgi:uroporphyrinogen decarboxylase